MAEAGEGELGGDGLPSRDWGGENGELGEKECSNPGEDKERGEAVEGGCGARSSLEQDLSPIFSYLL